MSDITKDQIDLIHLHKVFAGNNAWDIDIHLGFIIGSSSSMVYDIKEYIKTIKVPDDKVHWL
jgi:hypothetical protein